MNLVNVDGTTVINLDHIVMAEYESEYDDSPSELTINFSNSPVRTFYGKTADIINAILKQESTEEEP